MFEVIWIQDHMEWRYVSNGRGIQTWRPTHNNFNLTGRMAPKTFRKYNERDSRYEIRRNESRQDSPSLLRQAF